MMASQTVAAYSRDLAKLEAKLARLDAREKELCANENGVALSVLNDAIRKCKEEKIHVRAEYQEQLKKLSMEIQRIIGYDVESLMTSLLNLQELYFHMMNWLCKWEFVDQDGEQKTGWAQFLHDNSHYNGWNYDA